MESLLVNIDVETLASDVLLSGRFVRAISTRGLVVVVTHESSFATLCSEVGLVMERGGH